MTPNDFISSCTAVGLMIFESDIWIVALQRFGSVAFFGYALWALLTAVAVGAYLHKRPKVALGNRLLSLCKKHTISLHSVVRLPQLSHVAFTAGIFKPKIYLSTGLIDSLNTRQLEAVLLHEFHHLQNHDSRIAMLLLASRGIRVVMPFFTDIEAHIKQTAEQAADQFVIKKQGTYKYVQQALNIIAPTDHIPFVGAHFACKSESRVDRVSSHSAFRPKELSIAPSRILSSVAVGIFWAVVYSWHLLQPAHALMVQKQPASCSLRECISTCMGRGFMTENQNFSSAESPDT